MIHNSWSLTCTTKALSSLAALPVRNGSLGRQVFVSHKEIGCICEWDEMAGQHLSLQALKLLAGQTEDGIRKVSQEQTHT